ncbi:MAG TPA: hypothetical protein DDY36_02635 [Ruminococcaceae bacterium]|nr:hypothetical protein [Oscillospiraceae bacterium]HBI53851.1 hypothetical protein [Oscillospiraceae bacterium]
MPYQCYCPNCGNLLMGYKNKENTVKYSCGKCKTFVVRKEKGRRNISFDTYQSA